MHRQPSRPPAPAPGPDAPGPANPSPRRIRSEQLLAGSLELVIEHHGREYRLRLTQNGKLILTA
jgi:hemin uptake protein HemP